MKSLLKASVGTLALITGAGVAMAQSDTSSASAAGSMASDITCAQLAELDSDQQELRLYYIAGYQSAQASSGMGMGTDTTAGADTGMDSGSGADVTAGADTGSDLDAGADVTADADAAAPSDADVTAGADTGASGAQTDTTASADTGTADVETDTTASADTGMGTGADSGTDLGTDSTTTAGTSTSGSAAGSLGGFPDIPVDTVMSACQDNPDSAVLDILRQEGISAR